MGILSVIFIGILGISLINGWPIISGKIMNIEETTKKIGYTKSLGLLALIIGLLGQLIGLFSAFEAIDLGEVYVTPSLITNGFYISMITTVYGIIIFVLSLAIWFILNRLLQRSKA